MIKQLVTLGLGMALGAVSTIGIYEVATPEAKVVAEASGVVLKSGDLGAPDIAHPATGSFTIIATGDGGRAIQFSEDFSIVHAPDPHVRVNGEIIAKVVNYEGAQAYPIPNLYGDIETVDVWCKIAGVYLAIEVK